MRQNRQRAKKLQQARSRGLKADKNPSLASTKKTLSILLATTIGCSAAFVIQQSSVASVTANSQNLGHLQMGTSTSIQNSSGGNTALSDPNSNYNAGTGQNTSYDSTAAEQNFVAVKNAETAAAQSIQTNIESCATDGIGKVVQDNLNLQMTVWGRPIDVNKMFSPSSQGGCFADIGKIIDLSAAIPTFSMDGIINAAQQMIVDYATKKACDAMKTASAELVGPLNDVIGEINKAGQYTDVSGALGNVINKELGKIDEGLVLPSGAIGSENHNLFGTPGFNPNTNNGASNTQAAPAAAPATQQSNNSSESSFTQTIKGFFS